MKSIGPSNIWSTQISIFSTNLCLDQSNNKTFYKIPFKNFRFLRFWKFMMSCTIMNPMPGTVEMVVTTYSVLLLASMDLMCCMWLIKAMLSKFCDFVVAVELLK